MELIRLLLVDDHEIVRAGLRALLSRREDLDVVGEAASGEEAVELARQLQPDVVLMDVSLPGISGPEATSQIIESVPEANVLALSVHEEEAYFLRMIDAGACGYVPKRSAPHLLFTAIRTAADGAVFLDPAFAGLLVQKCLRRRPEDARRLGHDGLTTRQREVLTLVAQGLSNRAIGERLGISVRTVHRHRSNIRQSLDLEGPVDLVKYAIRTGLVELEGTG